MSTRNSLLLFALLIVALPAWSANYRVSVGGQTGGGYGYGDQNGSSFNESALGLTFIPDSLSIDVGDTVTFTNVGGAHNVASDTPGIFRCANGCDNDGNGGNGDPAVGWTVTVPFNTPGIFGFHCEVHQGMGMVGSIRVSATTPPPAPINISTGMTGIWYDPTQSGHGFDIEVLDASSVVAVWYVFDAGGKPLWLVGQGSYSGNTATLDVNSASGGLFPPNFDQSQISRPHWGKFVFTFADCGNGTAAWTPDAGLNGFTAGTLPIKRLTLPSGLTCP